MHELIRGLTAHKFLHLVGLFSPKISFCHAKAMVRIETFSGTEVQDC